jgi:hypothetical protein
LLVQIVAMGAWGAQPRNRPLEKDRGACLRRRDRPFRRLNGAVGLTNLVRNAVKL